MDFFILTIDNSVKGTLFDIDGNVLFSKSIKIDISSPHPGWYEMDPLKVWQGVKSILPQNSLSRIGISNQRNTLIIWDKKTGLPIYPAISEQDRRMMPLCSFLKGEGLEEIFRSKTGLFLQPFFYGTKLIWILDNVTGARDRAEKGELLSGTLDTWIIWHLTKQNHLTDVTNAAQSLFYNIYTNQWDPELLELLDIPSPILPQVVISQEVIDSSFGPIHTHVSNIQSLLCDKNLIKSELSYLYFADEITFFKPTGKYSTPLSSFLSTLTPFSGEYMIEKKIERPNQIMELIDALTLEEIHVFGRDAFYWQQQANLFNIPIIRSDVEDPIALGTAILAGLKEDLWKNKTVFHPSH